MPSRFLLIVIASVLLASCATLSRSGVGRVNRYSFESSRLPKSFDGFTVAFVSDIHYPSKFTRKRLSKLVRKLRELQPHLLLMGGDYVSSDEYIDELFDSVSSVKTEYGIFAVMGNHERARKDKIVNAMQRHGISLLNDDAVAVLSDTDTIMLAGVGDSFKVDSLTRSPSDAVADSAFTILLAHTPDYAEDVDARADLVLSGHTHGGQVSLLGLYTPVTNSHYGTRFNKGLNYTDASVPIITTTGVGTSRRKIRFCVPSEIVFIVLEAE